MNKWRVVIVSAVFAVATGGVALAANNQSTANTTKNSTNTTLQATVHHEAGTVNSISNSDLVLQRNYKGKTHDVKFMLNSNTKKDGTINKGERVEVYYKHQKNERIATEVKPLPARTSAKTS
jgi:hypothetical protein